MGSVISGRLAAHSFDVIGCDRGDNVNEKVVDADVLLIAVKPQGFDELAESISADLSDKLIISIMAGTTIVDISEKLGVARVVRSMPNLATGIGEGVTGWVASDICDSEDKKNVEKIFATFGHQFELQEEDQLNEFGAIAGCGPAYFFYLSQLLQEKAEEFGFAPDQAARLARYTFVGAAKSMEPSEKSAEQWVKDVASKGGVTEQALKHMKEHDFETIFKDAIEAAKKKSEKF